MRRRRSHTNRKALCFATIEITEMTASFLSWGRPLEVGFLVQAARAAVGLSVRFPIVFKSVEVGRVLQAPGL